MLGMSRRCFFFTDDGCELTTVSVDVGAPYANGIHQPTDEPASCVSIPIGNYDEVQYA
jgi:hypothetical protein